MRRAPATLPARGLAAAAVAVVLAALPACGPSTPGSEVGEGTVTVDSVDAAQPGTVFRFGPADPEILGGPVYPPVVTGDEGQVSIYEGFFVQEPCSRPLRADARQREDTIVVRVISEPDTARVSCEEDPRPNGYALLVGQFEPGAYMVRVIHEGDLARTPALDTVYENITVRPNPR